MNRISLSLYPRFNCLGPSYWLILKEFITLLIIICSLKSVGGGNTSDSFAANASSKQVLRKHS